MDTSKFTPGPWFVNGKQSIRGPNGEYIAKTNWDNGAANARLIAAAPELFAACEALVAWDAAENAALPFDDDAGKAFYERVVLCQHAMDTARAALAKARGEGR